MTPKENENNLEETCGGRITGNYGNFISPRAGLLSRLHTDRSGDDLFTSDGPEGTKSDYVTARFEGICLRQRSCQENRNKTKWPL